MKAVLLAGGLGTRISEESHLKPKPMIDVGDRPILWHIMKIYAAYGVNEFIVCCGYKAHVIKEYFSDYFLYHSDVTFDFSAENQIEHHTNVAENWRVTLVDTGLNTMTGGRIKRIAPYLGDEPFFLTYGDGVADVNISDLLKFHQSHGKKLTITTVDVDQRFGVIDVDDTGLVHSFREKSKVDVSKINGGFMVCDPSVIGYIDGDDTMFERAPMENIAKAGEMMAFHHDGFWHCMDTQRDKTLLDEMWQKGDAPWRVW